MIRPICVGTLLMAALCQAQAPGFEVASVKLDQACGNGRGPHPSPGRLMLSCTPANELIRLAYWNFADGQTFNDTRPQIVGAPGWLDTDNYDVDARAVTGTKVATMAGPMLQALLEERFKLKIHREARALPVFTMTEAKGGHKLQMAKEGSCVPMDFNDPHPPAPGEPRTCGTRTFKATREGASLLLTLDVYGASLATLANHLGSIVGRPVIDKTSVGGLFDIHLEYAPDNGTAPTGTAAADDTGPSIFTAIQKLGLKLTGGKGPVEVLVVDHIERPSEN